jgi:hypothetical protein
LAKTIVNIASDRFTECIQKYFRAIPSVVISAVIPHHINMVNAHLAIIIKILSSF